VETLFFLFFGEFLFFHILLYIDVRLTDVGDASLTILIDHPSIVVNTAMSFRASTRSLREEERRRPTQYCRFFACLLARLLCLQSFFAFLPEALLRILD
jgi:hypothetical protein